MEQINIRQLLAWVSEAQSLSSTWRKDSWEDWEFRDGRQWTASDYHNMVHVKNINPLTINRMFPILNLIMGKFLQSRPDIIAKGRSQFDTELAHVMSEALAYVRDQNRGRQLVSSAFNDQITAGFGYIEVGRHYDPRLEPVMWRHRPWYSLWWDPYGTPWLDKETCRYAFSYEWTDLQNLLVLFYDKKSEIEDKYLQLTTSGYTPDVFDPSQEVENYRQYLSPGQWVQNSLHAKRVRPVEMWYSVLDKCLFAVMPNSRIIDIETIKSKQQQAEVIQQSVEIIPAVVKKMRVATFVSDLLLQDIPSPYAHDVFPFVPFVSYLDRFNQPFGVPRQIKEQSMEVNKRRSMALALVSSRRITAEKDAVDDLQKLYTEANMHNGMVVTRKGKMDKVHIQEMSELAASQVDLMRQSEREIQEIVGATDEAMQTTSYLQSAVGLEKKQEITGTVLSSLFENALYSQLRLAELTSSMIQNTWTAPRILRVTDKLTSAEKFINLNERIMSPTGVIEIKNSLADAAFDLVPGATSTSATERERQMELLFSAISKAPPEMVGSLLHMAFQLSDIAEKDVLLRQLRQALGLPSDSLSQEEQDQVQQQQERLKLQQQAQTAEFDARERESKIQLLISEYAKNVALAKKADKEGALAEWEAGMKAGEAIRNTFNTKEKGKTANA